MDKRKKGQRNGLIEPYTVMIQGNPRIVRAKSLDEAIELAEHHTPEEVVQEQLTEQEEDGR